MMREDGLFNWARCVRGMHVFKYRFQETSHFVSGQVDGITTQPGTVLDRYIQTSVPLPSSAEGAL